MPIVRRKKLIFIHIPKTGGTSLERYFIAKYGPINLMGRKFPGTNHTPQHLTYREILKYGQLTDEYYTIISIVRNPYTRIISDLLFNKMITLKTKKEVIEIRIKNYLESESTLDNHKTPQYEFLINNGQLIDCILLNTEKLTEQMRRIQTEDFDFSDFDSHENKKTLNSENYMDKLTPESIRIINQYYAKDFEYFGYEMIHP